jgi:hypothetical protein
MEVQVRKARIGRNPIQPEANAVIPERAGVKLIPGKILKSKLEKLDFAPPQDKGGENTVFTDSWPSLAPGFAAVHAPISTVRAVWLYFMGTVNATIGTVILCGRAIQLASRIVPTWFASGVAAHSEIQPSIPRAAQPSEF